MTETTDTKVPTPRVVPFLWFDGNAEEAVAFYLSVFGEGQVHEIVPYADEAAAAAGFPAGTAMTVAFELFEQRFVALNGGPHFTFTPAISFLVNCRTQAEVDHYWERLSAVPEAEQCGWLVDKYGLSWQIVPELVGELMAAPDPEGRARFMTALLGMKKIDMAVLQRAYAGE